MINNNQTDLQEAKKVILESLKYFLILSMICVIVQITLVLDIKFFGTFQQEDSLIESLQLIFLFSTIYLFFRLAFLIPKLRRSSILIGSFFIVCFIRENDAILDNVYHGFWVPVALLVTFIAIFYTFKDWKKGILELAIYLKEPSMKLMIFSCCLLLVFSRIFGMGSFWKEVMQDKFIYEVKAMIEEGIELLAYGFILFSAFLIYKSIKKQYLK
ncbi:hypothetical protein ACNSOP_08125 [Aliarcobacter lanthieri]|uniref:hypothetical protein n=1 Tax=Aliarcobacter lanthieri TaxID=1355374 RepID=UPI003AA82707